MGESDEAPIPMLVANGRLVLRVDTRKTSTARLVQTSTRPPRHSCASGVLPDAPLEEERIMSRADLSVEPGGGSKPACLIRA